MHHPLPLTSFFKEAALIKDLRAQLEGDYSTERVWCCQKENQPAFKKTAQLIFLQMQETRLDG